MDKESTKDKNIKKPKKPKTKTKTKPKVKAKVKPRQTQTQSQKVIVNLQDVKRKRTKTRRTRAAPQQPQVIYQQAPIPPQQDLNSIVREQLSRLVPQPVPQQIPQPVSERRVEQIKKPELVKTEMPKSIRNFNFTPVNTDRPLRLEQPDEPVLDGGQTKKLSKADKRLRKESNREGMAQADIESTAFRRTSVPEEVNDFNPVGIPQKVDPIKSATLSVEEQTARTAEIASGKITKKKGRPALTAEEKAERKEARELARLESLETPVVGIPIPEAVQQVAELKPGEFQEGSLLADIEGAVRIPQVSKLKRRVLYKTYNAPDPQDPQPTLVAVPRAREAGTFV